MSYVVGWWVGTQGYPGKTTKGILPTPAIVAAEGNNTGEKPGIGPI